MVYRCILSEWSMNENPSYKKVYEGEFTQDEIDEFNGRGYNVYFLPNYPSMYEPGTTVSGVHIDTFNWVFVDMDLKVHDWPNKKQFIEYVNTNISPTKIIDSGNGIHVY